MGKLKNSKFYEINRKGNLRKLKGKIIKWIKIQLKALWNFKDRKAIKQKTKPERYWHYEKVGHKLIRLQSKKFIQWW